MIKIKRYRKQFAIALCGYMGLFSLGYSSGWSAPVVSKLQENPDVLGVLLTDTQINWIVSAIMLGGLVGNIPLGPITNAIGRKPILIMAGVLFAVSHICLAVIKIPYAMMFFRGALGVACAMTLVGNYVYLGEVTSTEVRGVILGTTGVFSSLGFLTVYTIGHFVSYEALNYIPIVVNLGYAVGMVFVPESPLFLIKKGKDKEAKLILQSLGRKEDAEILSEFKQDMETADAGWAQLFTDKSNRKAFLITAVLYFLQHFSGITALLGYSTTIFEKAGSSIPPFIASIIIGVVQLLSGLITPIFIESYGRRFLLLISTFLSCVSMTILTIYLNLEYLGHPVVGKIKWLPLPITVIYFVCYSFGFAIVPATLVGEMFQLNFRSVGTAMVLNVNWITGFATMYGFMYLVSGVGMHVAFIVFSVACALAFMFALFGVPETKGKSLLEVQKMLAQ